MRLATIQTLACSFMVLVACQPTAPVVEKATPNVIAISYEAYGSGPTLTPEALDLAIEHCKKQKLFANYRGATLPSEFSAKEIHTFACERVKTDDSVIIANQAKAASASDVAGAFLAGYNATRPVQTNCNRIGNQVYCTSY